MRIREEKSVRVGLALSGGAARGIAHLGVLKVLAENSIPIGCIAGTSAGAIVAGAFAAGVSLDELEEMAVRLRWRDMGRVTISRLGIQSSLRMEHFLRNRLPVTRFEELRIPFAAVATDLHTGKAVLLKDEGDVPFAIRASCALPGWYVPVRDEKGRVLVDGGLVANVPVRAARKLGASIVIAVDVNSEGAKFMGTPQSAFGVLLQSLMVAQKTMTRHELKDADVVINPPVGHIRWDEVGRSKELILAGESSARESLSEIEALLKSRLEEATQSSAA